MKLDITKNKHQIQKLLRLTIRDSVPESYQGRSQLLETFKPSHALFKQGEK